MIIVSDAEAADGERAKVLNSASPSWPRSTRGSRRGRSRPGRHGAGHADARVAGAVPGSGAGRRRADVYSLGVMMPRCSPSTPSRPRARASWWRCTSTRRRRRSASWCRRRRRRSRILQRDARKGPPERPSMAQVAERLHALGQTLSEDVPVLMAPPPRVPLRVAAVSLGATDSRGATRCGARTRPCRAAG